jgi:hypothetical protein
LAKDRELDYRIGGASPVRKIEAPICIADFDFQAITIRTQDEALSVNTHSCLRPHANVPGGEFNRCAYLFYRIAVYIAHI